MLYFAFDKVKIKKLHFGREIQPINHSLYANDTIIFYRDNMSSIKALNKVIFSFECLSVLNINHRKSNIYFPQTFHLSRKVMITNNLQIKLGTSPFT